MKTLPVLFRWSEGEVTAVFPTELGGNHYMDMTCYAHIGQHSSCSMEWYRATRPAKPEEYDELFRELRQIYECDPDEPRLIVRRRITAAMTDERRYQQTELGIMEARSAPTKAE